MCTEVGQAPTTLKQSIGSAQKQPAGLAGLWLFLVDASNFGFLRLNTDLRAAAAHCFVKGVSTALARGLGYMNAWGRIVA